MKVAFFQPYLANWRIEFLDYFINKSDFDVVVYDGGFGGKNDTKSVSGNSAPFETKILSSTSLRVKYKGQPYPIFFSPKLFFSLLSDKPDVIITEGEINFINNLSIMLYCKLFNKKFIWWSLGKVRTRKKNAINKIFSPIINFQIKRSSCVMARNTFARDYYLENKLKKSDDIIVAPNSMNHHKALSEIDLGFRDSLSLIKGAHSVILYVGALTKEKRCLDLVKAFKCLEAKRDDIQLWIVGEGSERQVLEDYISDHKLDEKVHMFGKVFDGVGNYFSLADLVVVPGLGGLVINHAMIFGCPVISRLADGTELDLVKNGKTGYLLEDYCNTNLANSIEKALVKDTNKMMSQNAKAVVEEQWNIDIMCERVEQCIKHD